MCSKSEEIDENLRAVGAGALHQGDVDERIAAYATAVTNKDDEIPPKKRKTRRGRNKRRHPYSNSNMNRTRTSWNATKPDAPHNSNQFLIEDHGTTKEIDDCLKNDKMARTRDSSFSMDSDGEFYSSPDGEEAFLIKDFDDTYENFRTERFNDMTKNDIIEEFLQLEKRLETVIKSNQNGTAATDEDKDLQREIERLLQENESLKRENSDLRNQILVSNSSVDSESDSSESCSTSSSSAQDTVKEVMQSDEGVNDYSQMNGHSPSYLQTV